MRAAVVERPKRTVATARNDERPEPELSGHVIIHIWDLAFVRQVDPSPAENMSHLGGKYCGIGVDGAVNAMFLDQTVPVELRTIVCPFGNRAGLKCDHGRCPPIDGLPA